MTLLMKEINPRLKVIIKEDATTINVGNFLYTYLDTTTISVQKLVMKNNNIGLEVYASDGTTLVFKIDGSGNVGSLGTFYSL